MTITSGNVVIEKDSSNLIGISIGGGAPFCLCLYIVQVFDNTPAALDGTLEAGDELVSVNGESLKGKTKVEVAKMIQACEAKVSINYNKLHADVSQGKTLDILLKKVKHRLVESMGSSAADALGLSRAILCNDTLVQRLQALEKTENFYKGLTTHMKSVLHAFFDLFQVFRVFGDTFASMGVKEPQSRASEAFTKFGEMHRQMEKIGITMLKKVKPILNDLGTFLQKAIPDTKMTINKYADVKFEYLSYCLKVKEMDDEEQISISSQEPLYRVESGNYEYRLVLRCRQNARVKFAKLRSDVLIKLELLENKHFEHIADQLQKFSTGLSEYFESILKVLSENIIFPVEIDLPQSTFTQKAPDHEKYEEEGACGFDPSKLLDFDASEEAKPSTSGSARQGPSETKSKPTDLSDLVDLSGFTNMNQKFEELLKLDDESEPFFMFETKETVEKKSKEEPLLLIKEKEDDKSFLTPLEFNKKSTDTSVKSPTESTSASESLLFLANFDEPLINIESN
ncbi:PRKCA-binding protein [Copidosoma floridanum]|uniref:PRKCA-binding protein n=1 Tax=Copidosoma floridanum TaxID=29053 RepID=UPI0006C9A81C|nr:PRKCA-binding protein [Copidosoma floridanum]